MSGFKNFFRKNTNAIRNEPGNKDPNSSCEDGEDLYEAVDPEQEDNSSTFSPEAETSVWSENEFDDDEEDIYLNDSELAPAKIIKAETEDTEMPSLPPLPPRTRGPTQNNYPTIVLPSTNQQKHQQPPPVPDYKRFKQQVRKEDSVDSIESYEEFNETSSRDKLKFDTTNKPSTVNEEDSDSEDYESIDSPIDNQKSAHKFKNEKVLPLGTKGKSLEATPAVMPSLPPRSNRPCPPVPQEISEEMYECVESEPSATSKPEPAIFSKLASALRSKNLTKQSNKPEVVKPTPVSPDTYEIEDSPPLSHKNQQLPTRKLPEIPVIGDNDEEYEISDESPAIPNFSSDRKLSGTIFDGLKSRKLPPTPAPNYIQKEIPKPVKEDSQLTIKQRIIPYTHVMLKNKDADSESSLPVPFGRKSLKPNQAEINKPAPESKQTSFSKSPSFLQKQMIAKNIPSANNSAVERQAEKEINKPVKNNYWKHTPPKIQIPTSEDTISSEKPVKTNYPRHVPPKLPSKKIGQNQDDVTNANEKNSILADAMNKLKGFKGTTAKAEQDDDKTCERKFQRLPLKQTNQGSDSQADVSPYHKEQRCKSIPSVTDSRSHKDHGKKTSPSNEKVTPKNSLEDCSWYLPDVSRPDAEKKLRSIGKDGAFLVRNSQRGASLTPYSLSLLHSGRIYNLQIRKRSDNKYAIGSEKAEEQSFDDLVEMVSYHATIPIEIMGVGSKVYLLYPAQK